MLWGFVVFLLRVLQITSQGHFVMLLGIKLDVVCLSTRIYYIISSHARSRNGGINNWSRGSWCGMSAVEPRLKRMIYIFLTRSIVRNCWIPSSLWTLFDAFNNISTILVYYTKWAKCYYICFGDKGSWIMSGNWYQFILQGDYRYD